MSSALTMRLPQALAAVRQVEDLTLLVAAWGHEPCWEPLEAVGWAREGLWRRAARVGDANGFAWYGIEAENPAAAAATLARRLARRGDLAAAIALDPDQRTLALAIQTVERPELLVVDLERPARLGLACLHRVRAPAESRVALALRISEALAGRGCGRAFFRAFADALARFEAALPAPIAAEDRRSLALIQFTRVLFLYFVQSRGWLDGRDAFLAEEVDRALAFGCHLHRSLFRPLFFGTLNRRPEERRRSAARFGRIPFLNGGLFEPHPLERRWPLDVPDSAWRDAFDSLFERFHFTVVEDQDGPSVAPDTLGRVFEGVMDPVRRRATGTYYTPAALVRRIVNAAMTAHFEGRQPSLDELDSLTVLDPAVGSGAFLLGALEEVAGRRRAAGDVAPGVRRRVLAGLFGVDRDPMAVRLAELRLWLAVLAEEDAFEPDQVAPLPNLECLVRQGDSLLDPLQAVGTDVPGARMASSLRALRSAALVACGSSKRRAAEALARAERDLLGTSLEAAERSVESEIGELVASARSPTLFGGRIGARAGLRRGLCKLRERRRRIRAFRRELEHHGALPWFRYQSHFADVFQSRRGFSMVVGNPPWVRAEQLPPVLRARLRERYRWWRTGGSGDQGYGHQPDLAVAFLERAWELAAPGGTIALLIPSKVATAAYGSVARQAVAAHGTLDVVAPIAPAPGERFEAAAYPMALVLRKCTPPAGHTVRDTLDPGGQVAPQSSLQGGGPWIVAADPLRDALTLLAGHPRLGETWSPRLGAKTGANAAYLDPPEDVEPECVRLALRGRDLKPFRASPRHRLLWPHDPNGRPLARLPPRTALHLRRFEERLASRADADPRAPWWTCFRTAAGRPEARVVWSDLALRLQAAALIGTDGARVVPLNTCYVVLAGCEDDALALAAWLNASWLRAAAALGADEARGGYRRFSARVVSGLPFPLAARRDPDLVALARLGTRQVVQAELDARTAQLLDLGPGHRRALTALAPVRAPAGR